MKEMTAMKRLTFSVALLLVWLAPVLADAPDAKKTVTWMQALQQSDGGFAAVPKGTSSLRSTSAAIRALKYFGGELPDKDKCAKYVDAAFDRSTGGFADTPGSKPDVAVTAVGLMAVAELKMPPEKYADAAVKFLSDNAKSFDEIRIAAAGLEAVGKKSPQTDAWLDTVAKMRNADGTYGKGDDKARDTGGTVVIVLRLGGKVEMTENALKAMRAGQRSDGGFGKPDAKASDLETSYRVMRAFHMLKEKPDVKALRSFIAKCRNADGAYGVSPGEPSAVGPTYDAGIILHWLEE
jgi:hypothetical protein